MKAKRRQDFEDEREELEEDLQFSQALECAHCGKKKDESNAPNLKKCPRCEGYFHYCSKSCQKSHRKSHKKECEGASTCKPEIRG